jgi:hypothetical protein
MAKQKKHTNDDEPHGGRDRDTAADRPVKRHDYTAGANGDEGVDVDAAQAERHETFKPDKNGTGW